MLRPPLPPLLAAPPPSSFTGKANKLGGKICLARIGGYFRERKRKASHQHNSRAASTKTDNQ
jgi:hypothetical protein